MLNSKLITVFDFGARNIKIATGKLKNKNIIIQDYKIYSTPKDSISNGKIVKKKEIVEFLSKIKLKTKDIRLVLSSDEVVLRNFDFPKMDKDDLMDAIKLEMSILLPENVDEYILDCYVIEEFNKVTDEKEIPMCRVQGVATLKSIINDYQACFMKAGYKIKIVDIQSNSVNKLFSNYKYQIKSNENIQKDYKSIAVIDMGHENTSLTFIEDNHITLHRVLHHGSESITGIISSTLVMNTSQAEHWKHNSDFSFMGKENKNQIESILSDGIYKSFNDLTMEIYQVIEFFISTSKNKQLDHISIIGGGGLLPHISRYIQQYVNIPCDRVENFQNIQIPTLKSKNDLSIIVNCIGAFIRRG